MTAADLDLSRTDAPPKSGDADVFYGPRQGPVVFATYLYCVITGLGVGAFCQAPALGTAAGFVVGTVAAVWVVPPLVREWRRESVAPAAVRLGWHEPD